MANSAQGKMIWKGSLTMDKRIWVTAIAALVVSSGLPASAKPSAWAGSPLATDSTVLLEKAGKLCRSGKFPQATPMILSALDQANDIPKCLAIAAFTEPFAFPMMEVRRQCMQKALQLCQTRQDYVEIALKARQYQFFEITRVAINHLVQGAQTTADLFDLARKSQEVALNDVAHQAMEKAYSGIKSVPEAIKFAIEVKSMGMDDLARKCEKDLIDDEESAHELCMVVSKLEPLQFTDLNRYGLKKALDKAATVQDCLDIYELGRRCRETDIFKLAEYRGRKLKLINQIKSDRAAYQQQVQAWQEGVQVDLAKQQQEAERNLQGGSGGGASAPEAPASGF
jgi:hypothetical protein